VCVILSGGVFCPFDISSGPASILLLLCRTLSGFLQLIG
jgi:hypothetical protein